MREQVKSMLQTIAPEQSLDALREAVSKLADQVLKDNAGLMLHLPDDFDECDMYIRTAPYSVEEAAYAGECKDLVRPSDGEWMACPADATVKLPIKGMSNRHSLCGIAEVLLRVLDGIEEWRTNLRKNNK